MDSFLKTLMAVLNDQPIIADLPTDKLSSAVEEGTVVRRKVAKNVFLKIVRLQTLISRQQQMGETIYPSESTVLSMDPEKVEGTLCVAKDIARRIMMLEQIIIEVVREAISSECDRFDVNYYAYPDESIRFIPMRRQIFLD